MSDAPKAPARSAVEIAREVREGTLDPTAVVEETLVRIEQDDPRLNALRSVDAERALIAAEAVASRLASGQDLPLAGVPVVIKDNVAQAGVPNLAGRALGADEPAETAATLVARLVGAGAVIVGRANMDELAYGVTGTNVHTGPVRNPVDPSKHPGGSSAGSGAAVAGGLVPVAVGTDTGGSVRIPAALCGVVGLRPTRGRVPLRGVAPLSRSLDTAGPLARTVDDAALLLSVLAAEPRLATAHREVDVKRLRVAFLEAAWPVEVARGIQDLFAETLERLGGLGLRVREGEAYEAAFASRASGPIIGAEASHAWAGALEAHPEGFGEEVRNLLEKGQKIAATRYLRAWDEATAIVEAIDGLFEELDVLLLPTTAATATPVDDPGAQLPYLALTAPFSLSGHPALSVPMGRVDGLPVGLQVAARRGREDVALAVAAALEAALG